MKAGANVNAANNRYGAPPLMLASQNGHAEVVKLLLAAGANVNATANNGSTSLMAASSNGHVDVIQLLKAAGADK